MVQPNYGISGDLTTYGLPLLETLYPYAALPQQLANDLQRAQIAASAQTASAAASAAGGVKQANISAASDWKQLLAGLAAQYQQGLQEQWTQAAMNSSNNMRSAINADYWLAGTGMQPDAGSAWPGGVAPDFTKAYSNPLAYMGNVLAAANPAAAAAATSAGRSGGGNMGTVLNYPSYAASGPATMPTYSAAAGFDALGRPTRPSASAARTGYNLLTGDRQLMTTGQPSGNEEIIRVGPGNQIQDVQPLPTAYQYRPPQYGPRNAGNDDDDGGGRGGITIGGRTIGGGGWNANAGRPAGRDYTGISNYFLSRMGQPQPASFNLTDRVGNPPSPNIPYGNDSVFTEISPTRKQRIPPGILTPPPGGYPVETTDWRPDADPRNPNALNQVAGLAPNPYNITAQQILAMLNLNQSQPTYSAAGGFTPDPSTALRLSNNSNNLSTLPSMSDLQLRSRRTPQPASPVAAVPPAPAPAPAPVAPAINPLLNNLPVLAALRTGTPVAQAGYSNPNLKEVGIGEFPNPMMAASVFQRSTPAYQRRMLDLWGLSGIGEADAFSQLLQFTPGARFNQRPALSYG